MGRERAIGARIGRLRAGLDIAVAALQGEAHACVDLLADADRHRMMDAIELLRGISQRAWSMT